MNKKVLLMFTITLYPAFRSFAQDSNKVAIAETIISHTFRAKHADWNESYLKNLRVPEGFRINVFAKGLGRPRMMEVMPDGTVYVTDRDNGTLTMIKDTDRDGKADKQQVIWQMEHLHGIDQINGELYLVTVKNVYAVSLKKDGTTGSFRIITSDLPDAGQHHNRTLKFGPDSMLYVSIGSTCNSCLETNRESAAMLQCRPDGTARKTYAKGLRNTIGFDWHPATKELWGWDNGIDHLGDTTGKEELNRLIEDKDYGWPFISDNGVFVMHHTPRQESHAGYDEKTVRPVLTYNAHAASMEFMFYTGNQFPHVYHNSAFVAMRGSWNREEPSGHNVLFVQFNEKGEAIHTEEFLSGFLIDNKTARFGRPVGIAQYTDGSVLVSDDLNGIIYRISYGK